MELPSSLEPPLIKICDLIFALIPQEVPSFENLQKCKIISHRGQHDNVEIVENTFNAFDIALNTKGVWGIELDIRWTKDLCPVVFHDPDLQRLYGLKIRISETTRSKLKKLFPQIPTLKEIVSRYGEKLHLMVEAKEELNVQTQKQNKILEDIFQIILKNIISEKKVKIAKFGTFKLRKKNQRIGRNPKTKEAKIISERNVILFKPSKELKKYINNGR